MNARAALFAFVVACLSATAVQAKPYRAMVTRTAETTRSGNLELGLRYQGFFSLDFDKSQPYQQISPSARFGIVDSLEANIYLEVLALGLPGDEEFKLAFGDIPIGLQWTFLEKPTFALAAYVRGTLPTGPSDLDTVLPTLSDGTWDVEGSLIAELRPSKDLRFMLNASYLRNGTRSRGELADFDVPDAVQFGLAGAYNLDNFTLVGLEVVGRYFLEDAITPAWQDNAVQAEIIPVIRYEAFPGLVLEAVAGVSVTPGLWDIYQFRALLGGTYEFDLGEGPTLPKSEDDLRKPKRPAKKQPSKPRR
ncbi:transporter [Hyalangium versicolor]|uniref:transporter n=1 Tax=Hyalangium versicolor TaxID=2861190 RepID=UPI001CCF4263|nr:transporter [Hyalangium versicolor]